MENLMYGEVKGSCHNCEYLRFKEVREGGALAGYDLICAKDKEVRGGHRTCEFGYDTPMRKSEDCFETRKNPETLHKRIEF